MSLTKEQIAEEIIEWFEDDVFCEGIGRDEPDEWFQITDLPKDEIWDTFEVYASEKDLEDAKSGKYECGDIFFDVIVLNGVWDWMTKEDFEKRFVDPDSEYY